MLQTTHHDSTSLAYAQSLLELAGEQNQAEPIGEELKHRTTDEWLDLLKTAHANHRN